MARIKLETTQNVLLEFELAGAGDRIVAGLLDILFIVAYFIIAYLLLFSILHLDDALCYVFGERNRDTIELLSFVTISAPVAFYDLIFEIFMNGQSPGKRITKLKVIKLDGSPPSIGDYTIRWLFRILDSFFVYLVGIITIAVTKKEQRLGDLVADTTVVKLKKRASLEDTVLMFVDKAYQPVFTDVLRFSDKDINTIKEALENYVKNNNPKHIDLLATKVKQILKIESSTMSSYRILSTLMKDYNYYSQEKI